MSRSIAAVRMRVDNSSRCRNGIAPRRTVAKTATADKIASMLAGSRIRKTRFHIAGA